MAPFSKRASQRTLAPKLDLAGDAGGSDAKAMAEEDALSPRGVRERIEFFNRTLDDTDISMQDSLDIARAIKAEQNGDKLDKLADRDEEASSPTPSSGKLQRFLSRRKSSLSVKGPDSAEMAKLGNPGLPLFSADSGDASGSKSGKLRSMFSWGRKGSEASGSADADATGMLAKKVSSLVPAGYENVFTNKSPPLTIAGKGDWALETVAVLNNGVRQELADMYTMLMEMEKRPLTLTIDDMDTFFEWFAVFASITRTIFDLEEKSIYAWIEGKDMQSEEDKKWIEAPQKITKDLSEGKRMKMKGQIIQHLDRLDESGSQMFFGRPVIEKLGDLAQDLDAMVGSIAEYLESKEKHLPVYVKQHSLTEKDRKRCEDLQWREVHEISGNPDIGKMVVVCASNWMDRSTLRTWKRKWLSTVSRKEYGEYKSLYHLKHCSAMKEMDRRLEKDEEERNQAAGEQDALRARVSTLPISDEQHAERSEPNECPASETDTSDAGSTRNGQLRS